MYVDQKLFWISLEKHGTTTSLPLCLGYLSLRNSLIATYICHKIKMWIALKDSLMHFFIAMILWSCGNTKCQSFYLILFSLLALLVPCVMLLMYIYIMACIGMPNIVEILNIPYLWQEDIFDLSGCILSNLRGLEYRSFLFDHLRIEAWPFYYRAIFLLQDRHFISFLIWSNADIPS